MTGRFIRKTDNFVPDPLSLFVFLFLLCCHTSISIADENIVSREAKSKDLPFITNVTAKSKMLIITVNNPRNLSLTVNKLKVVFKPVKETRDCGPLGPSHTYMFYLIVTDTVEIVGNQSMVANDNTFYLPVSKAIGAHESEKLQVEINLRQWMVDNPDCLKRFLIEGTVALMYDDQVVSDAKPFRLLADAWPGPIKYPNH